MTGAVSVTFPPGSASGQLETRSGRLLGFAVRETAGAAARFRLRNGGDANGQILVPVALLANESSRDWYGPQGLECSRGLFLEALAGAFEGVAWYEFD